MTQNEKNYNTFYIPRNLQIVHDINLKQVKWDIYLKNIHLALA